MERGRIELIGAPFDLCGLQVGSRLGPAALRLAGVQEALERLRFVVEDRGDVCGNAGKLVGCTQTGGMVNVEPLRDCVATIRNRVAEVLQAGSVPIVIGGDHALAMGSLGAAVGAHGSDLGVLWIDAHGDVNTPGTSPTGNVHGMPLAALAQLPSGVTGIRDSEWNRICEALPTDVPLGLDQVAWYALRDVDRQEAAEVRKGLGITMHDIDRHGVEATWRKVDAWFRQKGIRQLWISFDVDAMDPMLAPGTGTAVRGGLSYREAHLLAELIHESVSESGCPYRIAGLDVVEINPLIDTANQTAVVAAEWVASLFGKQILLPQG